MTQEEVNEMVKGPRYSTTRNPGSKQMGKNIAIPMNKMRVPKSSKLHLPLSSCPLPLLFLISDWSCSVTSCATCLNWYFRLFVRGEFEFKQGLVSLKFLQ